MTNSKTKPVYTDFFWKSSKDFFEYYQKDSSFHDSNFVPFDPKYAIVSLTFVILGLIGSVLNGRAVYTFFRSNEVNSFIIKYNLHKLKFKFSKINKFKIIFTKRY